MSSVLDPSDRPERWRHDAMFFAALSEKSTLHGRITDRDSLAMGVGT